MPRKSNLVWYNGEVINGLSFTTVGGRERYYYRDEAKKQHWLGFDKALAVARFRQLRECLPTGIATSGVDSSGQTRYVADLNTADWDEVLAFDRKLTKRRIASFVREWLISEPDDAAREIGIPELAYLHSIKPPRPSPTLRSLLETYLEKKRFRTEHERSVSRLFWNQFIDIVDVATVRELSKERVADYADKILGEYDRDKSQTWVKHRFGKIKAVLRFSLKRCEEADMNDLSRALSYCQVFELPPAPDPDPRPIAPSDFRKLHDAADDVDRALMLFALNCCMYAEEVRYAKKAWVRGDALAGYRYKKGKIPRIAVLWERTRQALAKLPEHQGDTVFEVTTRQIQRRFKRLRERVGLEQVEFRHIRDGSYTTMYDISTDKAKMVAGHTIGIEDRYVLRHPEKAAEVCDAVEKHYFPVGS